jgi:Glyoxalase-like domain
LSGIRPGVRTALDALDHLIWVTPDLERGIAELESRLGVRAAPGGRHPGRGTHNALLGLGSGRYLEILAPDPTQPSPAKPRWLGVDAVGEPRLSSWAAKCDDVPGVVARARAAGAPLGDAIAGGRAAPDGTRLEWTLSDPDVVLGEGLVPFLIDWGNTAHPSRAAPAAGSIVGLRAEHPDPARVRSTLETLGIELPLRAGPAPALIATIATTGGDVELR